MCDTIPGKACFMGRHCSWEYINLCSPHDSEMRTDQNTNSTKVQLGEPMSFTGVTYRNTGKGYLQYKWFSAVSKASPSMWSCGIQRQGHNGEVRPLRLAGYPSIFRCFSRRQKSLTSFLLSFSPLWSFNASLLFFPFVLGIYAHTLINESICWGLVCCYIP